MKRRSNLALYLLPAAIVSATTMLSVEASAQQQGYTADRLILAPNPDDGFATMRPDLSEKTRFFGNLTLDYIRRPLKMQTVTPDPAIQRAFSGGIISNQANAYFTAGGEFLHRFAVSVTMPVTFVNTTGTGDDPLVRGALQNGIAIDKGAPGDLRLDARLLIFQTDQKGFSSAVSGTYFAPTGNNLSFAGDGAGHSLFQILLEERGGPFIFNEFIGVHIRDVHTVGALAFQDEMVFGGGAFLPLRSGKVRIGGEIYGQTGLGSVTLSNGTSQPTTFKGHNTPMEWLGEVRVALDEGKQAWFSGGAGTLILPGYSAPDFRVIAQIGYWFPINDSEAPSPARRYVKDEERVPEKSPDADGDGIPDAIDACPTIPEDGKEPNPTDGCPQPADRDKDGIPDNVDKCPDVPEDKDGIDDEDGCPEDDVDKDGIPDVKDACPHEPGQPSPDPKQNGCPQFIRRIEGSNEIQILKRIEFDTGKATIKPGSFPILDEVVKLLTVNPGITKVGIEGHTDNRGAVTMNMKLSQDRADSCMKYMIDKGIAAGRLTAHGFGPEKPLEDNATDKGRQTNRRVEFHITEGQ